MKHCYTSVMRFWLRWGVVTLPVVVCVFFWIRGYWIADYFFEGTENVAVALGSNAGDRTAHLAFAVARLANLLPRSHHR